MGPLDLNFAFRGEPFVYFQSKSSIILSGMNYAFKAEPFVTNTPASGWANKISGISGSVIGKINGISISAIAKVNGV